MNREMTYVYPEWALYKKEFPLLSVETAESVLNFHTGIPQYEPTPLVKMPHLAKRLGISSLYVKNESHRFGLNAFKALGGSYAMARILVQELGLSPNDFDYHTLIRILSGGTNKRTFVTATDGNHGRGVAWAASQFQQNSVVYMPKNSSTERLQNIRNEGAIADILSCNYDDAVRYASRMANENGWILIQDTAWEGYTEIPLWILQGYLTMAIEALQQIDSPPTHLFLQAGVGSMAAAAAGFFTGAFPENPPRIILVEPNQADCLYRTAKAADGELHFVTGEMDTIMAGLACGEPNPSAWEILRSCTDVYLSLDDEIARLGMRLFARPQGDDPIIVSGESGSPGLGALATMVTNDDYFALKQHLGIGLDSRILLFNTEGDTDKNSYRMITAISPEL